MTGCFVGFCAGAGWLLCFLAEGCRDCGDVAFGSLAENKKNDAFRKERIVRG